MNTIPTEGIRVHGHCYTLIGSRETNQDSYLVDDEQGLYAVADGVGGGVGGEIASKMATDSVQQFATSVGALKSAVIRAQESILAEALRKHGAPVMGTTLTACRIEGGTVHLCHVGDSRCYLFRDGRLELRTEDHEFFDENLQATVLGSYLGIPTEEHPLQILEESFELRPGDGLLFCSDGLYRQIEEARMAELLRSMEEPELTLQLMCDEASQKPFSDNVTVVYVMVEAQ